MAPVIIPTSIMCLLISCVAITCIKPFPDWEQQPGRWPRCRRRRLSTVVPPPPSRMRVSFLTPPQPDQLVPKRGSEVVCRYTDNAKSKIVNKEKRMEPRHGVDTHPPWSPSRVAERAPQRGLGACRCQNQEQQQRVGRAPKADHLGLTPVPLLPHGGPAGMVMAPQPQSCCED